MNKNTIKIILSLILLQCSQSIIYSQDTECPYQYIHGYNATSLKAINASSSRDACCESPSGTYIIPVAVHVIQEFSGIDYPNDNFISNLITETNLLIGPYFKLELINDPSSCNKSFRPQGVYPIINLENEIEIKNLSRVDPDLVLNIWMVAKLEPNPYPSALGWAYSPVPNPTFPNGLDPLLDGIVLKKTIPLSALAPVLAHEFGHYLSLHHVWGPRRSKQWQLF